jgi:CheY-like chemotaxis protein
MKRKEPKPKYNHVLLLDDNELDNFINQKTMESVCFSNKIYINTSARSALEFLKNLTHLEDISALIYPEVIFVDLNMPVMDGFQFIEAMKTICTEDIEKMKIVILTSSLHEGDKQRAKEISEKILFLNKPLTKTMLDTI